jgi:hypothetical protein
MHKPAAFFMPAFKGSKVWGFALRATTPHAGFKGSLLRPPGFAGQAGLRGSKVQGSGIQRFKGSRSPDIVEKGVSVDGRRGPEQVPSQLKDAL